MNGRIEPALRKSLRVLALWMVLILALTAGLSPAAHARQQASAALAPAAFNKSSPADNATGQALNVALQWTASPDADSYQVCFDADSNNVCAGDVWTDVGNVTSVAANSLPLGALAAGTTYSWQVRASNITGTTYADGAANAFRSFTTGAAPGSFTKSTPANGAVSQPLSLNLTWAASSGAASYEYCLEKGTTCSTWIPLLNVTTVGVTLDPASTYAWHVRALNDFGTTYSGNSPTAFRTFMTIGAPGAFGKSTPANNATGRPLSLNLTWGASAEAASYEYCYDTTPDNACTGWSSTAGTSAPISGLSAGTTYYWQVRAVNSVSTTYADGADTAYWAFTTGPAPAAFNKTAPLNGATGQALNVSLTWQASTGAVSYEYCIDTSTNNTCDASWINVNANLSVAPPGLVANQTYSWHVRAINTFGTTDSNGSTNFWSFTTGAAPASFNKTSPSNGAANQLPTLSLTWNTSAGADSYEYCIATSLAGCTNWTSTGTNTSVAPGGLSAGTTYYWQVHAINTYGTTDANNGTVWSFTTGAAPSTFSRTSPGNGSTGQPLTLNLVWAASTGATGYEYCLDTSTALCNANWTSTAATSVQVGPLNPSTAYFWHVRAINTFGTTYAGNAPGTYWSFTTGTPPATFSRSAPANGSTVLSPTPSLSWAASTGATSYEYCIGTSTTLCNANWISLGNVTTIQVDPLNASTTYFWHVRAVNSVGVTYAGNAPSTYWTFTTGSLPGAFNKTAPANGATNQLLNVSLTWSTSSGAVSYEYCIDTSENNNCNTSWINVGTNLSVAPAGLIANQTYSWHVRAINTFGTTDSNGSSNFWSFTTGAAPANFNKTSPSDGATNQLPTLSLTWNASAGADTYEYCIATSLAGCTNWTSTGTNTSVAPAGLSAGTTYYWQVHAINAYGTTDANTGTVWSFSTGAAPTAFNKTSPANGALDQSINPTLQWSASTGFSYYEYCYDTTNNGACDTSWQNAGSLTSVPIGPLAEATTYYWQARAVNAYGITNAAGPAGFRSFTTGTLPGAFTKSTPVDGATNRPVNLSLTWTTSAGTGITYFYCIDTSTALCDANWQSAGTLTSAQVNLSPSTTYYWHVRATNNAGTTYSGPTPGPSAFFSFTTGAAPGAFGKINPTNGQTGRSLTPTLSWSASTGVGSYFYCYDTVDNDLCDGNWIDNGTNLSVIISSPLSTGTTYFWTVRAQNTFGTTYSDGTAADWWSFTTGFPPAAFDKTSPSNAAINQSVTPTLQWQASAGATSYAYCIDTTNDGTCTGWSNVGNTTSTSVTGPPFGPLDAGTTYYWHVRALNSFGTTYSGPTPSTSAFWSFSTGPAPGAFSKSAPSANATGLPLSLNLTWGASTNADHYEYCYSTSNPANPGACAPWTNANLNTSVPLSGLSEYTDYYWQVRAINPYGITYGNGVTTFRNFETGGKPLAFGKTSPANTLTVAQPLNPTLSWSPSGNATDYEYCLATTQGGCTNWTSTTGTASISAGSLLPSTIYYWHVRATNSFGTTYSDGGSSALWNFITAGTCPAITGWKGLYWRNEALTGPAVLCRSDADVHFDWQYDAPGPMIPADHFSARWTRSVSFPTAGQYRFYVDHDDGARLYIDGVRRGNWWDTCCVVDKTTALYLSAGKHTLRLEYREEGGVAGVHLWWEQINAQFLSVGAQDGWVLESSETSGKGGSINSAATQFLLGDDSANRQYRSILSFNTSGLPDNAVITKVTLKIKSAGTQGTNPFTTHGKLFGDVKMGGFLGSVSLQASDFQAASSRDAVLTVPNKPSANWYTASMISSGWGYINRTGTTQIRLRFEKDDNNDHSVDYIKFYSGNYATTANRPVLIIEFYLPP